MPVLLFRLNGVPNDEADEIRDLLAENEIEWYETDAGRWGISVAAIWLREESRLGEASRLIADYQVARGTKARDVYDSVGAAGLQETIFDRFRAAPVRSGFYLTVIAAIIYFSLAPFMRTW